VEQRRRNRVKRRITCELIVDGKRQSGIVLDVSAEGLFVQTAVTAPPGTVIDVRLAATRTTPEIALRARVARGMRVPPRLASVAAGGLGLRVFQAPPEFGQLLVGEQGIGHAPVSERKPEPKGQRYRVRLQASGSTRSRIVSVECAGEAEARSRGLSVVGSGWEVVEVLAES
jgi:hypothetical protein